MSRMRRNCVFGCRTFGVIVHRFPHPIRNPTLFSEWINIVGNHLTETDPMRIYNNKRVCDRHFEAQCKTSGHHLIRTAKPSINLGEIIKSMVTVIEEEHSYSIPREFASNQCLTNATPLESTKFDNNTLSEAITHSVLPSYVVQIEPSTSKAYRNTGNGTDTKRKLRILKNEVCRLRAKKNMFKDRLKNAEKLSVSHALQKVIQEMNEPARIFTKIQFTQTKKKSKGRRYTLDEKILALSLYKRSPRSYKLLAKYFTLPSKKTLKLLLAKINLHCGINNLVFNELKQSVSKLSLEDRFCTLIFDEMALSPQIHYNVKKDDLIGFENDGHEKSSKIADHVLVLMVKGIKANFKQPIAYYFCQNMKTIKLKGIIIENIKKILDTGLHIIATVCDQSTLNVSAINSLVNETKAKYLRQGKEWRENMFIVNNKKIIPLYDVPHLLKGLRNNLLNKDMQYYDEKSDTIKLVKWDYFKNIYEADKLCGELRFLYKITDEHIYESKIKKMKVKHAAQVFSHSFAVATEHISGKGNAPEECRQIIPFILMIDKLFDSLNSSTFSISHGKIHKCAVKRHSPHHKLWLEALKMLKSIKFLQKKVNGDVIEKCVPSVTNFIKTIEGFQAIWSLLQGKYSFDSMLTRNFNQDPIENFFGNIRSLGFRNNNLNCVGFEGAFKTVLLNNFNTPHSIGSNCEQDSSNCLNSLKSLLCTSGDPNDAPQSQHNIIVEDPLKVIVESHGQDEEGTYQRSYVCGWVLSKCLQNIVKSCKKCRNSLCGSPTDTNNIFIRAKEYTKNKYWLCYPSKTLEKYFKDVQNVTISYLQSDCENPNLKERIKLFLDCFNEISFMECNTHGDTLKKYFIDITINLIIFSWCRSVNRILAGKIVYDGTEDKIKKAAQEYYNRHKNRK